ncbi:porin [Lutibacter sp.]|uniref:porin n=1 Tax=Lutibacter sp. TaxID=1925666 RepID=UPI0025C2B3E1|nr:porin [Lutibacter sp.]MCF6167747.1 OprO/OprP family phosphate-selective porin [Lutibacter sp.]
MKNNIYILLVFVLFFQINTHAQGCDGDDPATTTDGSVPAIKIFGYLQTQYDYTFNDIHENTLTFKRARLGIRGKVDGDFSYYFMLEASPFIGGVGSAYLMDAFVSYEKYNWAKISVGTFKQPFSLEVNTPCNGLTTISRSIVADQLVAPQRDFGLILLGGNKYTKFRYAVALMNGRGLNVVDNNSKKDIIGRASYKLFSFLSIGGSFRYGYPNNNDNTRTSYGGEMVVTLNNLKIQSEYIYDKGDYNRAAGGGCGSEPVELGNKRDGGYIMISYDTKWKLQPVFKYEYFDPNIDVKKIGYQEMMTIGANYFVNDKIRFQLNYQAHIETYINIDNDILLAQIQVKF